MNPLMLYRSLPYIIIVVLAAALSWTTHLYLGKRDDYAALNASMQAIGEAAKANVEKIQKQSESNLQTVKEDHERRADSIRAGAVRNYLAAHPGLLNGSGCGGVPDHAPGIQVDDGKIQQFLPDSTLIEEAASDSAKLDAWQQWCQLNHCPVTD